MPFLGVFRLSLYIKKGGQKIILIELLTQTFRYRNVKFCFRYRLLFFHLSRPTPPTPELCYSALIKRFDECDFRVGKTKVLTICVVISIVKFELERCELCWKFYIGFNLCFWQDTLVLLFRNVKFSSVLTISLLSKL